jgi:hypothetical protein
MGEIERTNVIVVGAGASKELGLPVGVELKQRIAKLCEWVRKDERTSGYRSKRFGELATALSYFEKNEGRADSEFSDKIRQAAVSISGNMNLAPSIDNFMDTHSNDDVLVNVGKLAITEEILRAERESMLGYSGQRRITNDPNWIRTSDTWLGRLFGILVSQRNFESFIAALEKITFISFNYDRCIQEFFLRATQNYFKGKDHPMNQTDITTIEQALNIIHPYGSVGDISFNPARESGFGEEYSSSSLLGIVKASSGIQTFTEGEVSDEVKPLVRHALDECDVLIFLGFAFHPLNMRILTRPESPFHVQRVLATVMGLSPESRLLVNRELASHYCNRDLDLVSILGGTCSELFDFHHRYLAGQVEEDAGVDGYFSALEQAQ